MAGVFWGSTILVCIAVYSWATISFGIRFSNLTNRGIITNGPYRYTKHPAYIAKNLSWWMESVPFVSNQVCSSAAPLVLCRQECIRTAVHRRWRAGYPPPPQTPPPLLPFQ